MGRLKSALRYQLGSATRHMVYEGEGVGLILGMELIRKEVNVRKASIGIDNQSGIMAVISIRPTPSHYIWDLFHNRIHAAIQKHINLEIVIRWTPGHIGIEGNEAADKEAKRAAQDGSSPDHQLPAALRKRLPDSKSAAKQAFAAKLKKKAQKEWEKSTHYQKINQFDDSMPSKRYLKLVKPLRQKQASILYQLRTGHVPLAKHLHQFHKADSPQCPCCHQEEETVHHYLIRCPAHRSTQNIMIRDAGIEATKMDKILSEKSLLPHLFRFISTSGRLRSVFGNIPELETEDAQLNNQ